MSRLVTGLMTCMIAVAFTMGATFTAESARVTKAETVALKQAVVACTAEAKGKKIKWLACRKYVNQCVVAALKDHPSMDIQRMLKEHPGMRGLPAEQWDAF
ncbi:hypothetical protein SAMN05443247_10135 [Bradyrhizobium erythrophlei]|jgi:hypothetical protein|nr:hypothetical protein SAMN05443247_10135 [Bradyrhizobium erythrophlei]